VSPSDEEALEDDFDVKLLSIGRRWRRRAGLRAHHEGCISTCEQ
jgi:hypothetical protein